MWPEGSDTGGTGEKNQFFPLRVYSTSFMCEERINNHRLTEKNDTLVTAVNVGNRHFTNSK
jgi:hypothetical protein